jgi:hypothetical protein
VWPEERVWDILARRSMAMAGDKGGGRLNITGGEGMDDEVKAGRSTTPAPCVESSGYPCTGLGCLFCRIVL